MADKRLLSKERLDDYRKSVSRINDGMTPDHRAFVHNLLGQGVPDLLVHIEAQAKQIAELQAVLKVTWILCEKNKMPTAGKQVWAWCTAQGGFPFWGHWNWQEPIWVNTKGNGPYPVSHWMEIVWPEPPEKEGGGNE